MKHFDLQAYLKDLETVVNIDSGNHYEPGTNAVADFFRKKYEELGFRTEIRYMNDNHAAPFLMVRNSDSAKIDVLMVGHMDTVFAEGEAAKRPFHIDGQGHGRGPGCIDCKGGCVLMYHLIKGMKEAGELNFNFCVAMNSDEETKSVFSRAYFEELAKISDRCFVFEPGRANWEFVKLRKSSYKYVVKCKGIPAHSGVCPEKGASAVLELSRWVDELYRRYFLLEEGTTVNVGSFSGGSDNGSVPDDAQFTASIVCITNERMDAIHREMLDIPNHPFDPRCQITVQSVSSRPSMTPTAETEKLIALFEEAGRETDQPGPVEMQVTGGGSDGNFIAVNDCPTVDGCGPCGAQLHTADEYLIIESIEKRFDIMRAVLLKIFPIK